MKICNNCGFTNWEVENTEKPKCSNCKKVMTGYSCSPMIGSPDRTFDENGNGINAGNSIHPLLESDER